LTDFKSGPALSACRSRDPPFFDPEAWNSSPEPSCLSDWDDSAMSGKLGRDRRKQETTVITGDSELSPTGSGDSR
jgi:hypothetical protein